MSVTLTERGSSALQPDLKASDAPAREVWGRVWILFPDGSAWDAHVLSCFHLALEAERPGGRRIAAMKAGKPPQRFRCRACLSLGVHALSEAKP